MDASFFGLSGNPFARPDNAEAPCRGDDHGALTTELHAGLKAPHGITLLIGESGAGKTTFIRNFLAQLPETYVVAYLPTAGPGLRHLLTETIEQLGGTVTPGAQEQGLIDTLRALSKARAEHERSTLIVIDDAHDLPAKTIERLGKLFGSDAAEPSRLHLTLVGRAELLDRMNAANDRSILKHLVQVCRMDPMGPEDAFRYIADRVQRVGGIVDRIFTEDALRLVVQRADGNPGRIDALCAAAMERAAAQGSPAVDADAVEAAREGVSSGLLDGEIVTTEDEPNTPTYFFDDDDAKAKAETPVPVAERPVVGSAAHPHPSPKAAANPRRRLLFWALGATALVVAFAAMMSERGVPSSPGPVATKPTDGSTGVGAGGAAKPRKDPAARAAGERAPEAIPKLVAKRGGGDAAAAAVAVGADAPPSVAQAKPQPDRPRFPAPPLTGPAAAPQANAAAASSVPSTPAASEADFPVSVPGPQAPAPTQKAAPPADLAPAPTGRAGTAANNAVPAPPAVVAGTQAKPPVAVAAEVPKAPAAAPAQPSLSPSTQAKPPAAAPIAPTRPAVSAPAPKVIAPPTAAVASAGAAARFTVQIGAFSSRGNAEALLAKARGTAKDGRIIAITSAGKPIFRVVAGSFATSAEANTHAGALRDSGFTTFVRTLD